MLARVVSPDRNPSAALAEWARFAAETHVETFRDALLREYRWTHFGARVRVDRSRHLLHVTGTAPVRAVAERFERELRTIVPQFRVRCTMRTPRSPWVSLVEPVTPVWREWPGGASAPSLSTELLRDDGPVQPLWKTQFGTLVLAVDGTVGWIDAPTRDGIRGPLRPKRCPWGDVARSFIDIPYRNGGATREGFDCSSLTQRIYRDAIGAVLPRNCRGQRALARGDARQDGQLVFINQPHEPLHVGIVLRHPDYEWSVVHASSTRARVVEDPLQWYGARTE